MPTRLSLRFLSWAMMALRLDVELFRLLDSRYVPVVLDLVEGVGLGGFDVVGMLFTVAEMGMRGGGIESCRMLCSCLSPGSWLMLALEALRFQDRLSFRLSELMDDGVGGSSGLDSGGDDLAGGALVATECGGLGPDGLCCIGMPGTISNGRV